MFRKLKFKALGTYLTVTKEPQENMTVQANRGKT